MRERTKHSLISTILLSTLQMFMKIPMVQNEKGPVFLIFLFFFFFF